MGDTIAIEKLKSSIIINNKGELLFPRSEFGKKSEARNRLLVDLLYRTDFMEKAGTGIKRVTNACAKNNNKIKFEFSDSFWVTIQSNNKDKVGDNVGDDVVDNVGEKEFVVLNLIRKNNKISASDIAKETGISERTIQRYFKSLQNKDIIKRIGPDKGGHWEVI